MKTNKFLKVLSAATIISTIAVVDYSTTAQNNNKVLLAADTQNPEVEVEAVLMHAYENKPSMGNVALEGKKTTVQKVNNGYKYKVIWHDITYANLTGGIGHFWINGSEVPLKPIELPGLLNPKVAEFTLPTLESRIPVEVFVEAMDKIMPGNGKQRAFLQIETKGLEEKLAPKHTETESAPSAAASTGTTPKPTITPSRPDTPNNVKPSDKPQGFEGTPPSDANPGVTTSTPKNTSAATATFYKGVKASLLNAYQPDRKSMGDAALEHSNVTVFKEGSTYHYIVRFHDLSTRGFTGGISKFWVNGTEYPVNSTRGANNQVEVHFTSTEKLSTVPVTVFVQVMEDIMPGGGKQNATLSFDWSNVTEEQEKPIAGGNPGSSGYTPTPGSNPGGQPTSPITTPTTPALPAAAQGQGVEVPVTFYDNVTASLLNAYEAGRASMGNAALDGITVFKHGDTYHYKVRFHDIKVGTLTDGITRFWVNGTEYPVVKTGGAMNQVEIHFTSNEKLTNIPVSVFVPTMESIMPGAGKKDAILSLNWSNATERQGTAVIDGGQPGASAAGNGAGALTPKGGRLNNGRLSKTGLETSSSILAGALTLMSAFMVGRRKQK
ncbi:hypothetical protein [uncultured Gemella sp.]|uniref:hypothetical protein n=1 Tax=uncultured Gemella sp. TaxID=254352 RepID=UPI0028D493E6|nr:hypothetical protein [uncultured Gemella sp.]